MLIKSLLAMEEVHVSSLIDLQPATLITVNPRERKEISFLCLGLIVIKAFVCDTIRQHMHTSSTATREVVIVRGCSMAYCLHICINVHICMYVHVLSVNACLHPVCNNGLNFIHIFTFL